MSWSEAWMRQVAESPRTQLPMFCVVNSIAPTISSGRSDGLEIRLRKNRKMNGRRIGATAAAGFRLIQRQPMIANAGSARPCRGIAARVAGSVANLVHLCLAERRAQKAAKAKSAVDSTASETAARRTDAGASASIP